MKKKHISNRIRKPAVIVAMMVSAAIFLLTVIFGLIGINVDKTILKKAFDSVSEINYDLIFEDNPLYNESDLEFGNGYVMKYVDAIELDFLYDLISPAAAEISGSYSVDAVLEATYNSTHLIWKKEYSLIQEKNFTSGHVSDHLTLPLKEYGETAQSIEWDTGVTTSATMTIFYNVNAVTNIDGKPVTNESASTLTFDLSDDVLVMSGEPRKEQSVNTDETITSEIIPKRTTLIIGIPLVLLTLGAAVYLFVFTSGVIDNPLQLSLSRLYKKYGSRIAELYPGTNISKHDLIMVRSFRDLLLTADELKKPIFTNNADNYSDVEFYVLDDTKVYLLSAVSLITNTVRTKNVNIAGAFAGSA